MNFFTRFSTPPSCSLECTLPSMADQSQAKDCDINVIIDRYNKTGFLVDPMHPGTRKPVFGDFTDIPDYQAALEIVDRADEAFASLPSRVRERFKNDPSQIFEFLQDEKNRDEAIKIGLIAKPPAVDSEMSEKSSIAVSEV